MRFVPPVAGLSTGAVAFDGDPHMRTRPIGEVLAALRTPRRRGRRRRPRRPAVHGPRHRLGAAAAGSSSTRRRPRSSSRRCCSPARGTTTGVDVRHDGKPVPVAPAHRHDRRDAARARRRGRRHATPNRWAVAPGPIKPVDHLIEPDLSNAAPFLALAAVTGGRSTVRDWPRATTQAGDALRDILPADGLRGHPRRRRADRHRHRPRLEGIDVDLHDVGELTPAVAALCALADGPATCAASRTSAATRPTGWPRWPPSSAASAPT